MLADDVTTYYPTVFEQSAERGGVCSLVLVNPFADSNPGVSNALTAIFGQSTSDAERIVNEARTKGQSLVEGGMSCAEAAILALAGNIYLNIESPSSVGQKTSETFVIQRSPT